MGFRLITLQQSLVLVSAFRKQKQNFKHISLQVMTAIAEDCRVKTIIYKYKNNIAEVSDRKLTRGCGHYQNPDEKGLACESSDAQLHGYPVRSF